jgi:hypothetical protein
MWIQFNKYNLEDKFENKYIKFRQTSWSSSAFINLEHANNDVLVRISAPVNRHDFPELYPYYINDIMLDYYKALGGEVTNSILNHIYPSDTLKKILHDINLWFIVWGVIIFVPFIYLFFSVIHGNYYDLFAFLLDVIFGYYILKPKYDDYKRLSNILVNTSKI